MTRKLTLILFSLFLAVGFASAQSKKAYIKAAKSAAAIKDYGSALYYYKIIVEEAEIKDVPTIYEAAEVARGYRAHVQAVDYYGRVANSERQAEFPLANYWLGVSHKSLGHYDLAITAFQKYRSSNSTPDGLYAEKALKEINDCQWAINLNLNPNDSTINHLGEHVNSIYSEVGGLRIGDELYFTSLRFDDDVPETSIKLGKLMSAVEENPGELLPGEVNDAKLHTINGHFDGASKRLYYNLCENINTYDVRCAIYYREMLGEDKWGEPVKLPDYINLVGYTTTQPTIGVDKENGKTYLFFSSDRPKGKGGMDIWCSYIGNDGTFSHPENIAAFNTTEDDITPYYHAPSQRVFFSSKGRQNLGGYDIYHSQKVYGEWQEAKQLPYPISSSFDDVFFSLSSGQDQPKGYFSSNRPGTLYADSSYKYVCNDIFQYDIRIDLRALTFNEVDTTIYLEGCTVQLIEIASGEIKSKTNLKANDFDFYNLKAEREYKLIATKEHYGSDTVTFNTYGVFTNTTILKHLYLPPKVDLKVFTYTYIGTDTSDLYGCKVELFDITANKVVFDTMIPIYTNGNEYYSWLKIGHRYRITATKSGYTQAVALASTVGITEPTTLVRKLYLTRDIDDFKLMKVYFDNDVPGPSSQDAVYTDSIYNIIYGRYYARKGEFKDQFLRNTKEQEALEQFFEGQVRAGMERLTQFAGILLEYMERGVSVDVLLEGFASPLARPKYNQSLTERRVKSVENYFRNYSPILSEAIDSKRLNIRLVGFGERRAEGGSENRKDVHNSIYNVAASRERRVEIKGFTIRNVN